MATAYRPIPPVLAVNSAVNVTYRTTPNFRCFSSEIGGRGSICVKNRIKRLTLVDPVRCSAGDFGIGAVKEIDESRFSEIVLKSERLVLVEFVATWCGPCRLIAPAIQSIAQEYEDKLLVVKIDHDSNPKLIEKYKVYGLPTLIAFQNGVEIPESRREGVITKAKLRDYIHGLFHSIST